MSEEQPPFVCPKCHHPVSRNETPAGYVCADCGLIYQDVGDVPSFLVDDAVTWPPEKASGEQAS